MRQQPGAVAARLRRVRHTDHAVRRIDADGLLIRVAPDVVRAQGVFAGVSLSGTSLGPDSGANEKVYGKKITGQEIFGGSVPPPDAATRLLATLTAKSPANDSRGK